MSEFIFQESQALLWLFTLPLLSVVIYSTIQWRRSLKLSQPKVNKKQMWGQLLLLVSLVFAILGLARPGDSPKPISVLRSGRDLVFILDVSNSMLANDILPSRLERSKMAILTVLDDLGQNDRVALVLFSGSAVVASPLTQDYTFFRNRVNKADRGEIGEGGTNFGTALLKSLDDVFIDESKGVLDIIVLTDGEDQDSDVTLAIEKFNTLKCQLILVGIGDHIRGSRMVQKDGSFLSEDGSEVWTKLRPHVLENITKQVKGAVYLNVGTKNIELGKVYKEIVTHQNLSQVSKGEQKAYSERFQFFIIWAALFLFLAFTVTRLKPSKSIYLLAALFCLSHSSQASEDTLKQKKDKILATSKLMVAYVLASRAEIPTEELNTLTAFQAYNLGVDAFNASQFFKGTILFKDAQAKQEGEENRFNLLYNLGTCYYHIAKKAEELDLASEALQNATNAIEVYVKLVNSHPNHNKLLLALEASRLLQRKFAKGEDQDKGKNDSDGESKNSDEKGDEESDDQGESSEQMKNGTPSFKDTDMSLTTPENILQEELENNAARDDGDEMIETLKNDW